MEFMQLSQFGAGTRVRIMVNMSIKVKNFVKNIVSFILKYCFNDVTYIQFMSLWIFFMLVILQCNIIENLRFNEVYKTLGIY